METIKPLLLLAGCYSLLFLLFFWVWKKKSESLTSPKVQNGNWALLHLRHAGGLILMVLIPVIFLPAIPEGLLAWPQHLSKTQVMATMVTGLVLLMLSTKEADRVKENENSRSCWSPFNAVLHMIFRSSFLVGYEWFFRGVVLFSCVGLFGEIPAVIINIVLYAFSHSFNGRKEFLGSIPLGLLLCVFTLWWQSVLPAILLHLSLSFPFESLILHRIFRKPQKLVI